MKQARRWRWAAAMVLHLAAILSGCTRSVPQPAERLRIGFLQDPLASLLYVAQADGSFGRRGLEVTFVPYEGGTYAISALLAGTIDAAAATEFALVRRSFAHDDLRAIARLSRARNVDVLVNGGSGLADPQGLRGRRIGVSLGMNTGYILGTFLLFNGLRFSDVVPIDLPPSAIVTALGDGTIDAGCLYPPFSDEAREAAGPNLLAWPAQRYQDYYFLLLVRERFAREKPRLVDALLGAILEAEASCRSRPTRAGEVVGRALAVTPDVVARHWERMSMGVSLTEDLLTLMEEEARWIVDQGWEDRDRLPNCFRLLHYGPLERLAPGAAAIIH